MGPFWSYPVDRKYQVKHYPSVVQLSRRIQKRETGQNETSSQVEGRTRPDYKNVGHWAKGKTPVREIELDWVPLQIYSQVRRHDSVKHLPQEAAIAEAKTPEEVINAPRLSEVITHKKIQQVYEEEGFEDSAYDHGGYNHQGAQYEDTVKRETDAAQILPKKGEEPEMDTAASSESGSVKNRIHLSKLPVDDVHASNSISNEEVKNDSKESDEDSSKVVTELTTSLQAPLPLTVEDTDSAARRTWSEEETTHTTTDSEDNVERPELRVMNADRKPSTVVFPGRSTNRNSAINISAITWPSNSAHRMPIRYRHKFHRSHYYPGVQAQLENIGHYLTSFTNIPSLNPSTGSAHSGKFTTTNVPRQKFRVKTETANDRKAEEVPQRVYVNSADTLAAYASLAAQDVATPSLSSNNADAYGRRTKLDVSKNSIPILPEITIQRLGAIKSSPKTYPKNNYNNITRIIITSISDGGDHEPLNDWIPFVPSLNTRHPSMPKDSTELSEYQYLSITNGPSNDSASMTSNIDTIHSPAINDPSKTVKYIEQLTIAHFSSPMNVNIARGTSETKKNRLKELAKLLNAPQDQELGVEKEFTYQKSTRIKRESSGISFDKTKYPFYNNENKESALRYASNPALIPDKTKGGMAFYESRDKLMKCEDPTPPEDVVPKRDEDGEWNKNPYPENLPRMKGLGDKILCFKRKYFGENPLDNPFFQEKDLGNEETFKLDRSIKSYLDKEGLQVDYPKHKVTTKRIMFMPNSEESDTDLLAKHLAIGLVGNQGGPKEERKMIFKNHKPETAAVSPAVYELRRKPPDIYYETQEKTEGNINDRNSGDLKKSSIYPIGQNTFRMKVHKKMRPQPLPVSIYSVIKTNNYPYYRPIVYAHSNKRYRIIPVNDPNHEDNVASDSQQIYKTKPVKYYVIRPGEYTENKELLKSKRETSSIWSYMNPLRWWFPNLFDQRRNEERFGRKKRDLQKTDFVEETPLPVNHKPERSTTGRPISLAEFKARHNITDRPSTKSRLDMITGGFIMSKNAEENSTSLPVESTPTSSLETTTRSTIATTNKPKIIFPRTKLPDRNSSLTRKEIIDRRRGRKYFTSTTLAPTTSIILPPINEATTTRRSFFPKRKFSSKKQTTYTTIEPPKTSTESKEVSTSRNNENPRKLQRVEHRRVTEEEFVKTTYLPEENGEPESHEEATSAEQSSSNSETQLENRPATEDQSGGNETLTYLVDPTTGNGSWEYLRKLRRKPKQRTTKKPYVKKSKYNHDLINRNEDNGSEVKMENWESDTLKDVNNRSFYVEPQTSSEAYILGLLSKVTPFLTENSRFPTRRPYLQETGKTVQRRQGFVPKYTAKIPLKFILEPDKRKYYYVKNK
ncbi:uncharacterized protein [Rhodnius prolixus]|uniref:uncharacterized protein n=1 Tax=Rhodnius prolixus TaxID=13249 RepID=UPI003D18B5EA